ncbi:MAG: hypothetical protein HXL13_02385 [Candidatus Nanosynbacter sp.]|jgi:hypothetical protein|nr:hypothetical protein [Candidatus Nanosynbacter sp.]
MKFDFICGVILWVLPILLGLLSVKVVGVKKGKLETKYRFGSIGALVILLGSFLMILMFVIMGDMRDWDRFHQMTIMSHGGMEILKWVIGIFILTILLFAIYTLIYVTSCGIFGDLLNLLYQKKILGFKRRKGKLSFGLRRHR